MSVLDLAVETAGSGIAVVAYQREAEIEAEISGSAELPAAAVMTSLVQALHAKALAGAITTVTVDFTNLEFMNATCFKCLVNWVNDLSELAEAQRYKIRFRTNAGISWQYRSLHALKTMATDLISVES